MPWVPEGRLVGADGLPGTGVEWQATTPVAGDPFAATKPGDAGLFFDVTNSSFMWAVDGGAWQSVTLVGPPGQDGSGVAILSGAGAPNAGIGASPTQGALYLDTASATIYTRQGGQPWDTGTPIVAKDGADGRTILNGTGTPLNTVGADGDFFIDTQSLTMYGPKAAGAWPNPGVSMAPATLGLVAAIGATPGAWAIAVAGTAPNFTLTLTTPNTGWKLNTTPNDGTLPVEMTATYDPTAGGVINFTLPVDVFVTDTDPTARASQGDLWVKPVDPTAGKIAVGAVWA